MRGSISSNQLLLDEGAFIADTEAVTLTVQHTKVLAGGGIGAPAVKIVGTTLELAERGFIRARGAERARSLDSTTPIEKQALDGADGVFVGGGGASGGNGADGFQETITATPVLGGKVRPADISASAFAPNSPGGAGGSLVQMSGNDTIVRQRGGAGGGTIWVELRGALTMSGGSLEVTGETITAMGALGDVGAGAGGAIYVRAREILGSGQLLAHGGRSVASGGAGGGGRIAIAHQVRLVSLSICFPIAARLP